MRKKRGVGDEAMRFLSHRMRTEQEMRQHLSEREYDESEIEGAIRDLKTHHYIDDYEYALAFYRNSYEKLRGGMRTTDTRRVSMRWRMPDVLRFIQSTVRNILTDAIRILSM